MMTGTILEQGKWIKKSRKLPMKRRDKKILTQFATLVRQHFPEARIWVFGSWVKGTAAKESDLDVCIVLPTLNRAIDHEIMDVAWQVGFDHELDRSSP